MSMGSYGIFEELFSSLDGMDAALAGAVGVVLIVALIVMAVALAFAVAAYILNGIALSAIAKRRNIRNSWLAWVPVGNTWLVGCIADQYQFTVKRKFTNRRKLLLWLSIGSILLSFSDIPIDIIGWVFSDFAFVGSMLSFFVGMASAGVSLALAIFYYIALYDLFQSCNPKNSVLYLVLSIIFNVTEPIFLFINRNKDLGMQPPAKKPEEVPPLPEEPEAPQWETPEIPQPEETDAQ